MKKLGIAILIMGLIALTACQSKEEEELLERSKGFAKEFIMEEEDIEMVVKEAEFTSAVGKGTIFVRGHVKGDNADKLTVIVNYDKQGNLSSDGWGRGEEAESITLDEYDEE
jgi:hypothetical protein